MKIYANFKESPEIISDTYGENGPYTGYREDSLNREFIGVSIEKPNSYLAEELEVDDSVKEGDFLHFVCVEYSDGGTFGTTHGYLDIEGAYTDLKKADKVAKSIRNDNYRAFKPWRGYFASLNSVYIQTESLTRLPKRTYYT